MFSDDDYSAASQGGMSDSAPAWTAFFDSREQIEAFVQIAELASFSAAARQLGLGAVALRRLANRVERRQGERLFRRDADQVRLTAAGERLYAVARLIPGATRAGRPNDFSGRSVTLAIDEPLTHDLLRRGLMTFLRSAPGVRLQLRETACLFNEQDEADIAVQLGDIAQWSGRARLLGRLRFAPFGGRRQAQRQHSDATPLLVHYSGYNQLPALSEWNQLVRQRTTGVLEVDSSDLVRECLHWSGAVGLLPHYSHLIDRELMPVPDIAPPLPAIDVTLTVHESTAHYAEVSAVVTMLEQLYHDRREWLMG